VFLVYSAWGGAYALVQALAAGKFSPQEAATAPLFQKYCLRSMWLTLPVAGWVTWVT